MAYQLTAPVALAETPPPTCAHTEAHTHAHKGKGNTVKPVSKDLEYLLSIKGVFFTELST